MLAASALAACGGQASTPTIKNNCGPGAFAVSGECVALPQEDPPECGEGVVALDGECVPGVEPITCGEGARDFGGTCVPGAAPTAGIAPPPDEGPLCGVGTGLIDGECVRDEVERIECGEGTERRDGVCVPATVSCGEGTHIEAGVCVPDEVGARCGDGTEARDGVCVTNGSVICGDGTQERDGRCDLAQTPIICGPDTHPEGAACVADGLGLRCDDGIERQGADCVAGDDAAPCAEDTHVLNMECRADGRSLPAGAFALSADVETAHADGYTLLKIAALGRGLDGLPSTERVVVRADRGDAGRFQLAEAPLSRLGRPFWFRPCSYALDGDCPGPVTFELARADSPEEVLARTQEVMLTVPQDVPWYQPCEGDENKLWMHGARDHGIQDGERLVTEPEGSFFGFSSRDRRKADRVGVFVDAGDWSWTLWFDTAKLNSPPLAQVYPRVEGPNPSTNTPGLMLDSPMDHCHLADAEVQIREVRQVLQGEENRTERLALAFVADCVWPDYGRVVGCVNYTQPGVRP